MDMVANNLNYNCARDWDFFIFIWWRCGKYIEQYF